MFGTNYPITSADACMARLDSLQLADDIRSRFLFENAQAVCKLALLGKPRSRLTCAPA
jgi:predicted TIM-barrel fold metal-dependent hydrolase